MVSYKVTENFGAPGWMGLAVPGGAVALGAAAKVRQHLGGRRRAADHATAAERVFAGHLAQLPESLWLPLHRLAQPWEACQLWTEPKLSLGRKPSLTEPAGVYPVLLPHLTGNPPDPGFWRTEIGVRVRLLMPQGWTRADFEAKAENIASALNIPRVRVVDAMAQQIQIDLIVRDPITEVMHSPLYMSLPTSDGGETHIFAPAAPTSCHQDVWLGVTEYGDDATVNFAKGVHRAVQGATRTGKSITLNAMIAASMAMEDTVTVVIDPNAATVLPWWQSADYVCDSLDPADACKTLQIVLDAMYERKQLFAKMRTDRITEFSPELKLWKIFIDEVSNYEGDKEFSAMLKKVAKQAAKYGGRLTLADQKLSAEALSTAVRTNLLDRISHRVSSRQDFDHLFPDATEYREEVRKPSFPQGVAIISLMSHAEPVRARMAYLPTEVCFDLGDQMVAEHGAKRPPYGALELPAGHSDTLTPTLVSDPSANTPKAGGTKPKRHVPTAPRKPPRPPKLVLLNNNETKGADAAPAQPTAAETP
ncbi:FtsK/SpoIIIE domain-containing protein [Nocardia sp. 852002-51101_SCH5132738]|uniref:FtsK/SpoIIIE domain-containing protein n=1 Tax=Nocardia sp. 852002-51101_SCH5132738 TaxID=1834095 RepID=UPI0018D417B6|nr:FtsK/SpoIIIE domain-containing protein [Nocardia sp. 852002-51101_SCH5132738]